MGFKLKSLNMKKFIPFLLTLFLFACKQDTDPIVIDDSEPKVTEKYYLKYKIEDKWYLSQHSVDNFVPISNSNVFWYYQNSYLRIELPIEGNFDNEDMMAMKGKSFLFKSLGDDNNAFLAETESFDGKYNFNSVYDETNDGVLKVNDVIFVTNNPNYIGELIYKIKGTIENVKIKFSDGSIKYLTNGTFEFHVSTL